MCIHFDNEWINYTCRNNRTSSGFCTRPILHKFSKDKRKSDQVLHAVKYTQGGTSAVPFTWSIAEEFNSMMDLALWKFWVKAFTYTRKCWLNPNRGIPLHVPSRMLSCWPYATQTCRRYVHLQKFGTSSCKKIESKLCYQGVFCEETIQVKKTHHY